MASNDATPAQPSIGDYALIGDCHTTALVSRDGSIDWCCLPRIDSSSCFGRLLDWQRGGHCSIGPTQPTERSRAYLGDSLVLETRFTTADAEARVLDCFTMREGGREQPFRQLVRFVEGVRGRMRLRVEVAPRFDYGGIEPWIRDHGDGLFSAIGGDAGLLIGGDLLLRATDALMLAGELEIDAGQRRRLSIEFRSPQDLYPVTPRHSATAEELDRRFDQTLDWWRRWVAQIDGPCDPAVTRSAITIKALTYAPTGAIVAAATTSLPESPGGERNWDYRFTWIRDSAFALRSLGALGLTAESRGFRNFVERTAAGSADEIQVMYGVEGAHRLYEHELPELSGYRGARPVRIGNAAQGQLQFDIFGELVGLSWQAQQRGEPPDDDYWAFLVETVERVGAQWDQPDQGIWETRAHPEHHVHSKVLCWTALDRGVRLAEATGRDAPLARWRSVRDDIRQTVEQRGYHQERGIFVSVLDGADVNVALLQLPRVGFVDYDDERMVRTVDAIRERLTADGGLVYRYLADDGLRGREGAFVAASFWLVECLARQGRRDEASALFAHVCSVANDLGLMAEEYDAERGEMLGNYPQGLSHYAHIAAYLALRDS